MNPFDYIIRTYNVPARIGRRVTVYGKAATITADRGHYIGITYDTDKPSIIRNAHPVDGVVYLDEVVKPRKPSRSARRYQEFLECDFGQSFAEWLGIRRGA